MTDKERIINWINNLVVREKDYDTLVMLLNTNDRFFIRAMTEIAKGNLQLSDFETVFGGPSYDKILEDKLKQKEKIENDILLVLSSNDALNNYNQGVYDLVYRNLIVSPDNTDIIEEVRDEEIFDFFNNNPESSILFRKHKETLLNSFNRGEINKDFFDTYIGVPIIPINYNDIVLTEDDKVYALSKGISLSELKKIKSLSLYYKTGGA